MKLVKEHTEERLVDVLKNNHSLNEHRYCLHVKAVTFNQAQFEALPGLIGKWVGDENGKVYVCHDRDLFVFSPGLSPEIFARFKERCREFFAYDLTLQDRLLSFYDLEMSALGLIELAEAKLGIELQRRKAEDEKNKIQDKENQRETFHALKLNTDLVTTLYKRRAAHMRPEILVIEDDPFSRKLIGAALGAKFSVSYAEDGYQAIVGFAQKAPDIVFLDINLPDVNGHDVLAKILSIDPEAYVVMLSGNSQSENVVGAVRGGAKGFVGKPFTKEKLLQYISKCPNYPLEKKIGGL